MLLLLANILSLALSAMGALVLYPSAATLPFAVSLPTVATAPFPTMLFLHGNGSNGAVSELGSKTLWDGMGLLISLYNGGNHTGAQQVLAEEYLTILPLLPLGVREWDTSQVLEVLNAAAKTYELDASRILISGYSVGAFGAFDTAFASPTTFAALIPSASGSGFNDSQLSSLVDTTPPMSVYVMYAAGDEKQPASDIAATVTQLEALPGASKANITGEEFQGNHHLMTSTPFESPELWTWIENQTKGASAIFTGVANSSTASSTAVNIFLGWLKVGDEWFVSGARHGGGDGQGVERGQKDAEPAVVVNVYTNRKMDT